MSRVLKLLLLQQELGNSKSKFLAPAATQQVALANSLRTLENSLIYHGDEIKQRQAKLVFSATLRTLVQLEMIDAHGVPIGLAGLASHLFWGIWSIMQAKHSAADFDYLAYAKKRIGDVLRHPTRLSESFVAKTFSF